MNEPKLISRVVDEHGTTSTYEGGRATLSIQFKPHEQLHEKFARIVAHVTSREPLEGPILTGDVEWHEEDFHVFGLDFHLRYAAGAALEISGFSRKYPGNRVMAMVPASKATVEAAGEAYGEVLNRLVEIARSRSN